MINDELMASIMRMGEGSYREVHTLEDGTIVGIGELMYTRAIYMDMNPYGWGKRFCFQDKALADSEYQKLQSGDEEPVGWIARR